MRERLAGFNPVDITNREALARLPVLRKSDLPGLHKAKPAIRRLRARDAWIIRAPLHVAGADLRAGIREADPWRGARALFAAGFRKGDIVLNTFSYHLTPAASSLDGSARALGCAVIPAGPGNAEQQFELIDTYKPSAYSGTPDFLKILLDGAKSAGRDTSSISVRWFPGQRSRKSLQDEMKSRGIDAYQAFATADLGFIAYETSAREGLRGQRRSHPRDRAAGYRRSGARG